MVEGRASDVFTLLPTLLNQMCIIPFLSITYTRLSGHGTHGSDTYHRVLGMLASHELAREPDFCLLGLITKYCLYMHTEVPDPAHH